MTTPVNYDSTWSVLDDVVARAKRYLRSVNERRVAPTPEAVARLKALDVPLQNQPIPPEKVVEELDRFAEPATLTISGPRFFGFVNGGSLPATVAVNWLSTAWDQHGTFAATSPASTAVEQIAMRWIIELLGLPAESVGAFVTGTTVAHITALAAARDWLLAQNNWNIDQQGLFGAPEIDVIAGEEGHTTLFKALGVVGLGRSRLVTVPVDDQGRMRADSFPALKRPSIVCLQAGNVNTGSFDPFNDIIDRVRAAKHPSWVHVDGAFGIWARVAPRRAHLTAGIERADSWATDGHKWLNVPYDCGMAIVRNAAALRKTMSFKADYLPEEAANPADYTPEGSRRARGMDAWAALRTLGRSGLADLVERNCRLAKRFADGFAAAGYSVLNDVVLNQVLVSFGEPEHTRRVVAAIQADGTCWCGPTVWHGQTAMRVSVISWMTTEEDVDRSLETILRLARS
ncbi:MAG TPA: pyridoxal-dependent decarboxylase [Gemmatimonadaceae bacterium]|nr:pyridoxal-dependent decarboxylase [Gemmatimonadaceae bacterium]